MTSIVTEAFTNYQGRLSEGISYNPDNNSVNWVDIIAGTIYRVFLDNPQELESYNLGTSVGVIGFTSDPDIYVCGVKDGIAQYNLKTRQLKFMAKYPSKQHFEQPIALRSNEGSIDKDGNFWIGSFCDFAKEEPNTATFYKFSKDDWEHPTIIKEQVTCPNGLNWKDDIMYWTDSAHGVYKYKFDSVTGLPDMSTETMFVSVDNIKQALGIDGEVVPDGSCLDSEGNLYIATWGGHSVLKYDSTGKLLHQWKFPAKRVSCVTFGGPDLDDMFVTTADLNLDNPAKLRSVAGDEGGKVYRIKVAGVRGVEKNKFGGKLIV